MPLIDLLAPLEKAFVEEYLRNGKVATKAYQVATKTTFTGKRLKTAAYKFRHRDLVAKAIEDAEVVKETKITKIMSKYAITEQKIVEELAKIAFAEATDFSEWDANGVRVRGSDEISPEAKGAIAEVSEVRDKEGKLKSMKVRPYDKQQALITLGKHLGMFTEKHDHRVAVAAKFIIER